MPEYIWWIHIFGHFFPLPLVPLVFGFSWVEGTAKRSLMILYPMVTTSFRCRFSRVSHPRAVCVSVIGACCSKIPQTYRTALRWTFSTPSRRCFKWGAQTQEAYSSDGLTQVWYARVLVASDVVLILCLTNPSIMTSPLQWFLLHDYAMTHFLRFVHLDMRRLVTSFVISCIMQ